MFGTGRERHFTRWQKAIALVPLAVVAGAWSASVGSAERPPADPAAISSSDLPSVPTSGFQNPASLTVPPVVRPSTGEDGDSTTGGGSPSATADGIPDAAIAAYERTAAVLAQADPSCHLPWELVAAIGRVESDHGRYGGSVLNDDGVSTPGIFGLPLDGSHHTAVVNDTDGGALDNDPVYDRAVGAMQFIPSTWELVGVDGDGDGERNPQDIDDAALAAGVYLCAGIGDLATAEDTKAAIYSYNNSADYVAVVMSIMASYAADDYTTVDNGLPSDNPILGDDGTDQPKPRHHPPGHHKPGHHHHGGGGGRTDPGGDGGGGGGGNGGGGGGQDPDPGDGGNGGGGGGGGGGSQGPTKPVDDTVDPVVEATNKCLDAFADAGIDPTAAQLNECIAAFQAGGMAAVNNLIGDILDVLDDLPLPDLPGLPGLPGQG